MMLGWIKSLFRKQVEPPRELAAIRGLIWSLRARGTCECLAISRETFDKIIEEIDDRGMLIVPTPHGQGIVIDGVRVYRDIRELRKAETSR